MGRPRSSDSPAGEPLGVGRHRFHGFIAGMGTAEGTRLVVGHWPRSPLGAFTDVMVERADGNRMLLAPAPEVAAFVTATYRFDETILRPVTCQIDGRRWRVAAGPLDLSFTTGARTPLGVLLRAVPNRVSTAPAFSRLADAIARTVLRGVRTAGTAGNGRREYYGATEVRSVITLSASWAGHDLGALRPVDPPVRFGFSSTPRRPSVTSVVTTVDVPAVATG